MIKNIYDIEIYCGCMKCKTVHTVQVIEDNDIDVHYVRCDICGNIEDYTEEDINRIIK